MTLASPSVLSPTGYRRFLMDMFNTKPVGGVRVAIFLNGSALNWLIFARVQ